MAQTAIPYRPSVLSSCAVGALAVGVALVHVIDQGGLIGDKAPSYIAIGYWLLEAAALVAAVAAVRRARFSFPLAALVGAGPLTGFVLSRGPGLPSYVDDRGNWSEPLALAAVAIELALLAFAAGLAWRQAQGHTSMAEVVYLERMEQAEAA